MRSYRVLSWFLSACLLCSIVSLPVVAADDDGIATYGVVDNSGTFSCTEFTVGSLDPEMSVTVPARRWTYSPMSYDSQIEYRFPVIELGAADTLQTGTVFSGATFTDTVLVGPKVHSSLSGVVRYSFSIGVTGYATGDVLWSNVLSCKMQVVNSSSEVVYEDYLERVSSQPEFTVDVTFPEQTISSVRFIVEFSSCSKNTAGSQVRYLMLGSKTTLRWDGANVESEQVGEILDGVNQTNGLLSNVISTLGSVINAITDLPGKIIEGIKGLFVPTQQDLEEINAKWNTLLEKKLGFVWQAGTEVVNLASGIKSALEGGETYAFVFPGISFPYDGEELVILSETPVDMNNAVMDVLRPVLCTITTIVCVTAFVNMSESMLMAIVSGASYFQFLHRKDE